MKKDYKEYAEKALDDIFTALEQIKAGEITVLTGENGTGKSLIRKVIGSEIARQLDCDRVNVAATSMDLRSGINEWGSAENAFVRDMEWLATSQNSLNNINGILRGPKNRYVVLDEPEIGMGLNLQASVGELLKLKLPEILKENLGVMVITHSKEIVRRLSGTSNFVNIQGLSEEEWLNQTPYAIDLDEFQEKSNALRKLLSKHLKKSQQS